MAVKYLLNYFKRCGFSAEEQRVFEGAFVEKVEVNQEHRMIKAHVIFPSYVPFSHIRNLEENVCKTYELQAAEITVCFENAVFTPDQWEDVVACAKRKNSWKGNARKKTGLNCENNGKRKKSGSPSARKRYWRSCSKR